LFAHAVVAMLQKVDTIRFFRDPVLIVEVFAGLVFKVCSNRLGCHGVSLAECSLLRMSSFDHSKA